MGYASPTRKLHPAVAISTSLVKLEIIILVTVPGPA